MAYEKTIGSVLIESGLLYNWYNMVSILCIVGPKSEERREEARRKDEGWFQEGHHQNSAIVITWILGSIHLILLGIRWKSCGFLRGPRRQRQQREGERGDGREGGGQRRYGF